MRIFTKAAMIATLIATLSGCAMLPGSGPREQNIHANAAAAAKNEEATLGYDYVVVDVTRKTLPFLSQDPQGEFQTFGVSARGAPSIRLGPGDEIRVTVFESQTGGLFLPDDAGACLPEDLLPRAFERFGAAVQEGPGASQKVVALAVDACCNTALDNGGR